MVVKAEISYPIFEEEVETGELCFYHADEADNLLLRIEEFADILNDDFRFWDSIGRRLEFDQAALDSRNISLSSIKPGESQMDSLRGKLFLYARKRSIQIPTDASFAELAKVCVED